MNKEKIIFFGAIGVVVLIMVIYGVSVYSKKTTSSAAVDFTVPDLVEKDKTIEEYNNRLKKANCQKNCQKKFPRATVPATFPTTSLTCLPDASNRDLWVLSSS